MSWRIYGAVALLAVQFTATLLYSRKEYFPKVPPLSEFSSAIPPWHKVKEYPLDPETADMLAPSEFINRDYVNGSSTVNLLLLYYNSQHLAKGAHDPKVCLPAAGWYLSTSRVVVISSGDESFRANQFLVERGRAKAVVLYWFQTHKTTYTAEQSLHLNRLFETIADRRTDMELVRIVSYVTEAGLDSTFANVGQFAGQIYPELKKRFQETGR